MKTAQKKLAQELAKQLNEIGRNLSFNAANIEIIRRNEKEIAEVFPKDYKEYVTNSETEFIGKDQAAFDCLLSMTVIDRFNKFFA